MNRSCIKSLFVAAFAAVAFACLPLVVRAADKPAALATNLMQFPPRHVFLGRFFPENDEAKQRTAK